MKTMKFEITGMTCSACAQHVEKAVNKLDGIKTANVNLLTNRLTVEADTSVIGAEDIVAAVEKSGYGAFPVDEEVERASLNIQPASDCRGACPIKITTMKFDITGMTCSACAQHVEKAVNKLDGIKTANVNLLTNRLTVEADPSVIGAEDIIAAVEKSGYGAAVSDETTAIGFPGENQNTACSTGSCPIAFNEKSGSGVVNPNKRSPKSQKNGLSAERKKRTTDRVVGVHGRFDVRCDGAYVRSSSTELFNRPAKRRFVCVVTTVTGAADNLRQPCLLYQRI